MSKFLEEMKQEARVRLESYKRERETLLQSAKRVSELNELIEEAQLELGEYEKRIPSKKEKNDPT